MRFIHTSILRAFLMVCALLLAFMTLTMPNKRRVRHVFKHGNYRPKHKYPRNYWGRHTARWMNARGRERLIPLTSPMVSGYAAHKPISESKISDFDTIDVLFGLGESYV